MKHSGRAFNIGVKMVLWALAIAIAIIAGAKVLSVLGTVIMGYWTFFIALWVLFALFTIYFFRDPEPMMPSTTNAIVSPAHGKVDLIDEVTETEFMGGPCRRISIFLSVIDVHVQNAPVNGQVMYMKYSPGRFLSATKSDCAAHNENMLVGFQTVDFPGQKVAVRQIAGLIARRILTWVEQGEKIPRSQRIGLIQFGSRVEIYLPLAVKVLTKLGDRVKGGETVIASFEGVESIYK
jgi:phosphatidylserine decarboxylase